ncbi:MAG: type II toxin-antitoxin system VapC family toxin [Beijerinckiaceae bacterium]|nr:type II toxin-antitoxin system VapC family toxin [Beijerinckiaceae bacterium]
MIVVDTSALLAILLGDERGLDCEEALISASRILISAGTLSEAVLVAERRHMTRALDALLQRLAMTVVIVDEPEARRAAAAHAVWGRGVHPAGLNFGDCFAYAVAKRHDYPLLFVGKDFGQTDIVSALQE